AAGAHPLAAGARSIRRAGSAGVPLHQPQRHADANPWLVRSALVHRNHVPGGSRSSWRRDPAAVVGSCHPADHAGIAWALFSHHHLGEHLGRGIWIYPPRTAAWYTKSELTFSDAIAAVRRALWSPPNFSISRKKSDMVEIPAALLQRLTDTLCYAA